MKKLSFATAALAAGLAAFVQPAFTMPNTDIMSMFPVEAGKVEKKEAATAIDNMTTASIAPGQARPATRSAVGPAAKAAGKASAYDAIITKHAQKHGVPVSLARAVVRIESNFRPNARGRAGEIGLMQIKPATARMMGYSGSAKGLYDPETNIRWGMKYLAKAQQLGGGETCGTILRYNAGHGAKRMNKISAAYCAKVKRHMGGA